MRATEDRDRRWAERVRAGDEAAFEALFREYSAALYRFAYGYVRSVAVAEDLVQDVFFWLWKERGRLDVERSLRAYLYTLARSRALDHLRHEQVALRGERESTAELRVSAASPVMSQPATPEEQLVDDERTAALARAVEALPERCRITFRLFWREGLSYAEIATVMGVSRKTVENQLALALKTLRRRLAPYARDG